MTILILILVLSACASALLSRAFGMCAIWWFCLRAALLFAGAFVALTLLFFLGLFIASLFIDKNKPVTRTHHGSRRLTGEVMHEDATEQRVITHMSGIS